MVHRLRRSALILVALWLAPATASAQEDAPTLVADCIGVDHPPFEHEPPPGANSILVFGATFENTQPGAIVDVRVLDPSDEELTGRGSVDEDGHAEVLLPLLQYGQHTGDGLVVDGLPIDGFAGRTITVDDEEHECDASLLPKASTTTTTRSTTTTTRATSPGTVTTIVVGDETDGVFETVFVLPIVIGGVLILVGVVTYWRTRERPRRGQDPVPPGATPQPPPIAGATPDVLDGCCDWGVYGIDELGEYAIRRPQGHRCCSYLIQLQTGRFRYDVDARRHPDDDHALDERFALDALDASGHVHARAETPPDAAPPDVSAHQQWFHELNIWISYTSGCHDEGRIWTIDARSDVHVAADVRCTNRVEGIDCPADPHASASAYVWARGDAHWVVCPPGMDRDGLTADDDPVDHIPTTLPTLPTSFVEHDHANGPDQLFQWHGADVATGEISWDGDVSLWIGAGGDASVGAKVPAEALATTDEVIADAAVTVTHDIQLDGDVQVRCDGACHGHGSCRCAPAMRVVFRGGRAWVEVDGTSHLLTPAITIRGPGDVSEAVDGLWRAY